MATSPIRRCSARCSGARPPNSRRSRALQALQRVGVDTVVVHHGRGKARGLEDAVAAAVAAGRLASVARFAGPEARVYEGTMDEVVRPPARSARARRSDARRECRARDPAWRYSATGR